MRCKLAFIVRCIAVTTRGLDETRPWLRLAYLPALVLFVVFKPNLVLVATALALQFALTRGQEALARGTILALAVLGLAGVVGPQFFHDGAAWRHWLEYTQGMNGGKLTYSTDEGNMALATMMAGRADERAVARYALLLGFAMLFVFAAAITSMGKRKSDLRTPLLTLARDPWAAASIAILVTMACSPLLQVSPHAGMTLGCRIFWVIREGSRRRTGKAALAVLRVASLLLRAGDRRIAQCRGGRSRAQPAHAGMVAARSRRVPHSAGDGIAGFSCAHHDLTISRIAG